MKRIQRFMTMMDSMTNDGKERREERESTDYLPACLRASLTGCVCLFAELDCAKPMNDSRILRVAKGSGT